MPAKASFQTLLHAMTHRIRGQARSYRWWRRRRCLAQLALLAGYGCLSQRHLLIGFKRRPIVGARLPAKASFQTLLQAMTQRIRGQARSYRWWRRRRCLAQLALLAGYGCLSQRHLLIGFKRRPIVGARLPAKASFQTLLHAMTQRIRGQARSYRWWRRRHCCAHSAYAYAWAAQPPSASKSRIIC